MILDAMTSKCIVNFERISRDNDRLDNVKYALVSLSLSPGDFFLSRCSLYIWQIFVIFIFQLFDGCSCRFAVTDDFCQRLMLL